MTLSLASIILVMISPAVGSFLGVLVDRLPRAEDVIFSPSACRHCETRLGVRDLLPIASYAAASGRCRYCSVAIPAWSLYIEILAIGSAIFAAFLGTGMIEMVLIAVVLWLLLALGITDMVWFRLPDVLTGSLFCVALTWIWISGGDIAHALFGATVGAGSFLLLRISYRIVRGREGLGLGDVKVMAGIGALSGAFALPYIILIAALFAICGSLIQMSAKAQRIDATYPVPFGAALCASCALWWLFDISKTGAQI